MFTAADGTEKEVCIEVVDDTFYEASIETFTVTVSSTTEDIDTTKNQATISITDDDCK